MTPSKGKVRLKSSHKPKNKSVQIILRGTYHALELDTRLYLTYLEVEGALY